MIPFGNKIEKKNASKKQTVYRYLFGGSRRLFCLLGIVLLTAALAKAQTVTLKEKGSTLQKVLIKIRSQLHADLVGDLSLLKNAKPVFIEIRNKDVQAVLTQLSANQPVNLFFVDNTIIVGKKESTVENPQSYFNLTGFVHDEEGRPLHGTSVRIVDATVGVVTGTKGEFEIKVKPQQTLQVSRVGYVSRKVEVDQSKNLHIVLRRQELTLSEAIVNTGYTKRSQETLTGSAFVITREQLEKFTAGNVLSVIQNIDPSFKILVNNILGSNPNILPQITLRGITNVGEYAVNNPLVILDGFEVSLERLFDMDINWIDRIVLLKDASSTVLYGSRGGNGVLIVETRQPKAGKPLLSYELRTSLSNAQLGDYNLMNAAQKLDYERLSGLFDVEKRKLLFPDEATFSQSQLDNLYSEKRRNVLRGVDTYWLAQPIQQRLSMAHAFRLEGGNARFRYGIDANKNTINGLMEGSKRSITGGGMNLSYRIPQTILFRNYFSIQATEASNSPYGAFAQYTLMNPYQPIVDDNKEIIKQYVDENVNEVRFNPIYNAQLPNLDEQKKVTWTNNLIIEWNILPDLMLKSTVVIEKSRAREQKYISPLHTKFIAAKDSLTAGEYQYGDGNGLHYLSNLNLTYTHNFGKSSLSATVLGEINASSFRLKNDSLMGFNANLPIDRALLYEQAKKRDSTYIHIPDRLFGVLFAGNYVFDKKYIAEFSFRRDGSSKFGKNNRFANFWSFGIGYNLYREKFFSNRFFNELHLFANTGVTGTNAFTSEMISTIYSANNALPYYNQAGLLYINEGNTTLTWPQIRSWTTGIRSRFWDNRIYFNLAYYNRITDRMISLIAVAPSLGIAQNAYFENMGKAHNRGVEAVISFKIFENKTRDLNGIITVAANKNSSKLSEISDALRQLNAANLRIDENGRYLQTVYYKQGRSLTNLKGVPSLGIDPASGRELFVDKNGKIKFDWDPEDLDIVGNQEPKLFGAINAALNYRSWNMQALFNYSIGGDIYNQTLMDKVENNDPRMNADLRALEKRWRSAGDHATFKRIGDPSKTQLTSRFIQQENYVRLSTLMIFYDLPKKLIQPYRLQRLRFNLTAQDLFRWGTVDMERGLNYPFGQTYTLGAMLQF